jgi:very-short-patch-repair endonuclease
MLLNRTLPAPRPSTARLLRASSTKAERRLWRHLRAHRLSGYSFRRQEPIGSYIADFVCVRRRLVIEVDGTSHRSKHEYDHIRTRYPGSLGYRVLRFTNERVLLETRAVLRSIHRHITPRKPRSPRSRVKRIYPPKSGALRKIPLVHAASLAKLNQTRRNAHPSPELGEGEGSRTSGAYQMDEAS